MTHNTQAGQDALKACPNPWCDVGIPGLALSVGKTLHLVKCGKCGLSGPSHPTETEAIAAWNSRKGKI